jgi:hypothetical protein
MTSFERGTGDWEGVVMVERPDVFKLPQHIGPMSAYTAPMCKVMSARTVQLNGKRAICAYLPYALFKDYFQSEDGDHIFCEAELKDGHLEVYGKARTNIREWIIHSMTEEQAGGKVFTGYL